MSPGIILHLTLLAIVFGSASTRSVPENGVFTMRILHTNDMHSRFDQTEVPNTKCSDKNAARGKCFGGFARLATLIREARKTDNSTIFLNAGDTYQGTDWYTVHKWRIVSKLLNMLEPNVTTLGNHEFDDGPDGLIPFLNATTFPVVTANLDLTAEQGLAKSPLKKSVVLDVEGHKVGVIGYLTPETRLISSVRNVIILDEVIEIRKEVQKLQADGVNILIALGHSGFEVDKKIAAEVDGIDLVIGGHTNTFLYNGTKPDNDISEGLYPTEVEQKSGKKVYIVQAYGYTKYLGNLTIDFNSQDEIVNIMGNPILVDKKIQQAPDVLKELDENWLPEVEKMRKKVVGTTEVTLEGKKTPCRIQECKFGNVITDAMLDYFERHYRTADNRSVTPKIAFTNAGSIKTSIEKRPGGNISLSDVRAALPFNNAMIETKLSGKILWEALEWCVRNLTNEETSDPLGAFLHFSGMKVTYDLSKPSGSKVVSVLVRREYGSSDYETFDPEKQYDVLSVDFASKGIDGFSMLKNLKWDLLDVTLDEIFVDYLQHQKKPINPLIEGRISLKSSGSNQSEITSDNHESNTTQTAIKNNKPTETSIRNTESSTIGAITQKANSGYRTTQAIAAMIVLPIFALVFVS